MTIEELSNFAWPLVVLVISMVGIFVFKDNLGELISKAKKLVFPGGSLTFGEEIAKAKEKANKVGKGLNVPEKSQLKQTISQGELVSLAPRDIVLVSWGRMKQRLFDSVATRGIAPNNTESLVNILTNLSGAVAVPEEVLDLIVFLDQLGEDLAQRTSELPLAEDAIIYSQYTDLVMAWLHDFVVRSPQPSGPGGGRGGTSPDSRSSNRVTIVSSSFPEPNVTSPSAILVGTGGPLNGQRLAITQRQIRIGSDDDNDLRISGDTFVSSHHAVLRYDNGLLYIEDLRSTNGTLLNFKRLEPGYSHPVKIGDQIKMGESQLEVRSA